MAKLKTSPAHRTWSPWPPEREALLRAHYATASWPALLKLLGCTRSAIKCRALMLGLTRPGKAHRWTAEQDAHLRAHFATSSAVDLAKLWGLGPHQVYKRAHDLGLKKDPNFLSDLARRTNLAGRGAVTGFKKGHVPANKGKKMRPEVYAIAQRTMFRKGQKPHNAAPIGATRVNADGYLDRKVRDTGYPPRDWEAVHRLVWIEHHGKVPNGKVVCFKPGRRSTVESEITIDALECLTRKESMRRNSVHNLPAPLKAAIQTKGVLRRMINQRNKRDAEAQHR